MLVCVASMLIAGMCGDHLHLCTDHHVHPHCVLDVLVPERRRSVAPCTLLHSLSASPDMPPMSASTHDMLLCCSCCAEVARSIMRSFAIWCTELLLRAGGACRQILLVPAVQLPDAHLLHLLW